MASKRRIRRKSCTGKQRHATPAKGHAHIARLHRSKGWQGRMDVYRCRFCNGYHVGHSKGGSSLTR